VLAEDWGFVGNAPIRPGISRKGIAADERLSALTKVFTNFYFGFVSSARLLPDRDNES
jgi:hypothetical protein